MTEPAISVEGVGKRYDIGKAPGLLSEAVGARMRRREAGEHVSRNREPFWALRDVSLTVARGEVVGLIGANGAGKSTLMKLMANISYPTEGRIRMRGRVGTLLEVGTGFHPELSGRENVYLSGTILGMKRREIHARYNEIVEFSGIGQFIETPVKRYSSGMYVRLGFAVASHLTPEILLVDEVLAVGDADFQRRCLSKMRDVVEQGRTIVFVSHSMQSIQRICSRAFWVDGGRIAAEGPTQTVVAKYLQKVDAKQAGGFVTIPAETTRAGIGDEARFVTLELLDSSGQRTDQLKMREPFSVRLELDAATAVSDALIEVGISTPDGVRISTSTSSDLTQQPVTLPNGRTSLLVRMDPQLLPGDFIVDLGVHHLSNGFTIDFLESVLNFSVGRTPHEEGDRCDMNPVRGAVRPRAEWTIPPR